MMTVSLFELTIGYQYKVEGNVQPLVDYLSSELKDEVAKDFIAKVLLGEIKKGDKRRVCRESRNLYMAFIGMRYKADLSERERGDPHITDDEIYARLDEMQDYEYDTAERMIKRYSKSVKARRVKRVTRL
jgi:hypothetical protein